MLFDVFVLSFADKVLLLEKVFELFLDWKQDLTKNANTRVKLEVKGQLSNFEISHEYPRRADVGKCTISKQEYRIYSNKRLYSIKGGYGYYDHFWIH